jgi:Domain of unknown function (DUF4442)
MRAFLKRNIRSFIKYYPPLLGAGVHVRRISADYREVDVEMKLRFWNANYVGTHYGGSLYSMTDPFYMLILIENLGRNYIVWDKAASIRFRKPGRGKVTAQFRISAEEIEQIRQVLEFTVEVKNEAGEVVAEVQKTLYVRKKQPDPQR